MAISVNLSCVACSESFDSQINQGWEFEGNTEFLKKYTSRYYLVNVNTLMTSTYKTKLLYTNQDAKLTNALLVKKV